LATIENHLIERLPRKDRARLLARCETVPLVLAQVLCDPGKAMRYAYFPVEGFVSMVAVVTASPGVEVGMVGREGMLGAHIALGVPSAPLHALVQGAGTARRIGARAFRAELAESAALRDSVNRYLYVLLSQLATSAACLRFHLIGPRLARWLLMSEDRSRSNSFRVTQEFLAYMLGVRRVGITAAAGVLQRSGLIEYHRGELTVVDRSGLEAAACSCYRTDRDGYDKLL
jgi:CRP-like cAMP-binding protein